MSFVKRLVKKYGKPICCVFILLVTGIILYVFNASTPLALDDYNYSMSFATGDSIKGLSDIFISLRSHYHTINGRLITHFLAHFFLYCGKGIFNIINTLAFLLLGILIYRYSGFKRGKECLPWLAAVYVLLYLVVPAFGESFLWVTGAANYLYSLLIALLCLMPYRKQLNSTVFKRSWAQYVYIIPNMVLGFIAGATNENTSVAIICLMVLVIADSLVKKEKNIAWMFSGPIGAIVGLLSIITAPGTKNRLETSGGIGGISAMIRRGVFISLDAAQYLPILLVVFIVVFLVLQKQSKSNKFKDTLTKLVPSAIFSITALASIYSMVASPQFPVRVWTAPIVLLLIAIGCMLSEISADKAQRIRVGVVVAVLAVCVMGSSVQVYYSLKNTKTAFIQREQCIYEQIEKGERDLVVENVLGYSKFSVYGAYGDLSTEPDVWPNTVLARYYGVDTITRAPY